MTARAPDLGSSIAAAGSPGIVLEAYPLMQLELHKLGGWRTTAIMPFFGIDHVVVIDFAGSVLLDLRELLGANDVAALDKALVVANGKPVIWSQMPEFTVVAKTALLHAHGVSFEAISVRPA